MVTWTKEMAEAQNRKVDDKGHVVVDGSSFFAVAQAVGKQMAKQVRVRQATKPKCNKLELEWGAHLRAVYGPGVRWRDHAKTYLLANGVRYTPDWVGTSKGQEIAWEVKGSRAWDDAMVKIKVAAHEWPEVQWWLCWTNQGGQWQTQRVLP